MLPISTLRYSNRGSFIFFLRLCPLLALMFTGNNFDNLSTHGIGSTSNRLAGVRRRYNALVEHHNVGATPRRRQRLEERVEHQLRLFANILPNRRRLTFGPSKHSVLPGANTFNRYLRCIVQAKLSRQVYARGLVQLVDSCHTAHRYHLERFLLTRASALLLEKKKSEKN
jgi:hypothetical protein